MFTKNGSQFATEVKCKIIFYSGLRVKFLEMAIDQAWVNRIWRRRNSRQKLVQFWTQNWEVVATKPSLSLPTIRRIRPKSHKLLDGSKICFDTYDRLLMPTSSQTAHKMEIWHSSVFLKTKKKISWHKWGSWREPGRLRCYTERPRRYDRPSHKPFFIHHPRPERSSIPKRGQNNNKNPRWAGQNGTFAIVETKWLKSLHHLSLRN